MSSKTNGSLLHTVTFRLTLLYALLFAGMFLVFVVAFGFSLAANLRNRADSWLREEVGGMAKVDRSGGLEKLRDELGTRAELNGVTRVLYALYSPGLEPLATSDLTVWRGVDLKGFAVACRKSRGLLQQTLTMPGSEYHLRVIGDGPSGGDTFIVGITLEEDEELLEHYWNVGGLCLALTLIAGSLVGWFIAGRAMAGVKRVTGAAVGIGRNDLGQRVPVRNDGAEVETLALAFNEMLDRIQSLVTELKEISNTVAHDLRSPLTRIRIMAEALLVAAETSERSRDTAAMIVEESDRLIGIVNTMLEIAAAETEQDAATMQTVDLGAVAAEARELFEPLAADKGVRLDMTAVTASPLVSGDKSHLQRVIANLVDNAIKYTPAGGRVTIAVQRTAEDVIVSVADTGIGIATADLPRVFDRFFRSDSSRTAPGSGLGLTLVRAIVHAHGGDITVTSTVGSGSTFTVRLPALAEPIITKK